MVPISVRPSVEALAAPAAADSACAALTVTLIVTEAVCGLLPAPELDVIVVDKSVPTGVLEDGVSIKV